MRINIKYSPNFSKKPRKNKDIKFIVIHYTGMQSEIASVAKLLNPKHKVSCHYLINKKGEIFKMVKDNKIAWHAGRSKWKNIVNLNKCSIGIELVNKGHAHGYEKFARSQIRSLIKLCLKLKKKYKIKQANILGHSDIAPLRKKDPGEKFPWKKLNKNGLGIWAPYRKKKYSKTNSKKLSTIFFKNLHKIGYRYFNIGRKSKNDNYVIKAFQRRFLPNNINGIIDQKTYLISHFLARKSNI